MFKLCFYVIFFYIYAILTLNKYMCILVYILLFIKKSKLKSRKYFIKIFTRGGHLLFYIFLNIEVNESNCSFTLGKLLRKFHLTKVNISKYKKRSFNYIIYLPK